MKLISFAREEESKPIKAPDLPASSNCIEQLSIPLFGGIVIIVMIALILFKKLVINSHGLILGFWMLMWLGSVILNTWDIRYLPNLLIYFHIVANLFGLIYWILLAVRDYHRKNTQPSINLLFEIGVWFFMFILSCIEIVVWALRKKQYKQVSYWYPVVLSFITMVENFCTKGREMRTARLKSQLVKKVEDAFHEVIEAFMKEPQSCTRIEFDHKVNEFTRLFNNLEAQQREALLAYQHYRKAMN